MPKKEKGVSGGREKGKQKDKDKGKSKGKSTDAKREEGKSGKISSSGKMVLDSYCSTITLSSEKEQLLVRLLQLLQPNDANIAALQHTLKKQELFQQSLRYQKKLALPL